MTTNGNGTNGDKPFRPKRLTTDEIREGCLYLHEGDENETRICVVNEELRQGLDTLMQFEKSVTFFGSARTSPDDPYYKKADRVAARIVKELGYAVAAGGGPGIMGAANQGAFNAGGQSIGITIKLPMEQKSNPYLTVEVPFYFFFTRKVALAYSAEAYLYFPGGFGTLDEFGEILTLVQTNKIAKVPMILVGVEFWQPLVDFFKTMMLEKYKTISPEDLDLFTITDDEDLILDIIKKAPIRQKD